MKKTTQEYAEKLAKEKYDTRDGKQLLLHNHYVMGYLKAIEMNAVPELNQELLEMSELQLQIIYKLIGNKKVVNLDESIAYFESMIKKAKS